ncbi:MAG: XrtA-associated ATPase [Burkholderiaceae bacterium]|nr:XrtA-associated ATPase [Burkholderiaceae bacterium]
MYEQFYGLSSKPFQLNPDPSFYFGSKQHRRAKAYLDYGVSRNEGFIVITGEIGAGKTTLLRTLIESLHGSNVVVGHLVTTQLGAEDTLRMVGASFGFKVKDVPKSELLITLEAFLISQTSKGKRCLLIVDEAQNLTPRAVEELRMLSNFQFGNQALMQSFLVGQPEFREILQRPEMEQFRQRVAATCHIGPMDRDETQHYIEHRLKCAGATDKPSFEPACFDVIHKASGGIPRRINSICDRVLLAGFLGNKTHLEAADVEEVVREFAQEAAVPLSRAVPAAPLAADSMPAELSPAGPTTAAAVLDVDLGKLQLDPAAADTMSRQLNRLAAEHRGDQLQRLERHMLRLERTNLQILTLMQQLVAAVKQPQAQTTPAGPTASATPPAAEGLAQPAPPSEGAQ